MKGILFKVVVAVYVLGSTATVVAGGAVVYFVESGVRTVATVDNCVSSPGAHGTTNYDCTGTWVIGGPLTAGGHVVVGSVVGAGPDDVGKSIPVSVSGGTAYVRSLSTGLVLIILGVVLWLLPPAGIIMRRRRVRRGAAARGVVTPAPPVHLSSIRPPQSTQSGRDYEPNR
jgi:hypothetical protein